MRFPKVYAVQVMIPADHRGVGSLLCSHLSTWASENPYHGRTLFIDLQNDPQTQALKDKFLALRSWVREVVGESTLKATWAPRWTIGHATRSRVVYAGLKDGKPFITAALAEESGIELSDLKTEMAELFE